MATRVSLAELSSAGLPLHPSEAAAIVQEVCRQYVRGAVRGIPSAHVIRLTRDGHVVAEGPISPNQPPIVRAAQLLNDLLPPFDASPPYRVPGGLRLIVARALGTIDLPPFESLDEFCAALDRFSAQNLDSAAQNLFRSYEDSRGPKPLTISDVRRARRATGLSLEDISAACAPSRARVGRPAQLASGRGRPTADRALRARSGSRRGAGAVHYGSIDRRSAIPAPGADRIIFFNRSARSCRPAGARPRVHAFHSAAAHAAVRMAIGGRIGNPADRGAHGGAVETRTAGENPARAGHSPCG